MHELSVTENLLKLALKHAEPTKANRITDLYLVIGQLSSIIDDSVQFYWDFVSKGTLAEGAQLHFERIPTEFLCLDCNKSYFPDKEQVSCPYCDGIRIKILTGNEFRLEAIEIEN
jgi:hydrogenase nickel incorporation protein HypA/HybF